MTTQPPPYGSPEPGKPPPPGTTFNDDELRQRAITSLKRKRSFRAQLFSFVVIMTMLWIIWLVAGIASGGEAWFPWPIFPTLGWGIGLAFTWRAVYGPGSRAFSDSEVDAEIRRLRGE